MFFMTFDGNNVIQSVFGAKNAHPGPEMLVWGPLLVQIRVESDSGFQSPPIFRDFPLPPPFFGFFQ